MRKQTLRLVAAGCLLNGGAFLSHRLFQAPDFVQGLIQGVGIGVLLLALIKERRYKVERQ